MQNVKGRIVEINKNMNTMTVLTSQGQFLSRPFPKGNFQIGDEIKVAPSASARLLGPLAGVASVAAVIGILFFQSVGAMAAPAYYVHVDISNAGTPSIELAISNNLRVVGATPLNDEGSKILSKTDFNSESVQAAIKDLMHTAEDLHYIGPEKDNTLLVSIAETHDGNGKQKQIILKKIRIAAKNQLEAAKTSATLGFATVDSNTHKEAVNRKASINSLLKNKNQSKGTRELPEEYEVSRIAPGQAKKVQEKDSWNSNKKSNWNSNNNWNTNKNNKDWNSNSNINNKNSNKDSNNRDENGNDNRNSISPENVVPWEKRSSDSPKEDGQGAQDRQGDSRAGK